MATSMSPQSIASGGALALKLFIDREADQRRFVDYLIEEQPREQVLFFYGNGGNGKSLLLWFLQQEYCERNNPNRSTKTRVPRDPTFNARVSQSLGNQHIPSALLDFSPGSNNDDSNQQAFTGLLRLQRILAPQGVRFPVFTFAALLYLRSQEGRVPKERLATLFPSEELDLVVALADTLAQAANQATFGGLGLARSVLGVVSEHFGGNLKEKFTLWSTRRGLNDEIVAQILAKDPDRELLYELPRLFAEDLNTAMRSENAPRRIVLFFDTHEAFWGDRRSGSRAHYYTRDRWLRSLINGLNRTYGIVAVVAGRELPKWNQTEDEKIPDDLIDARPVEHLSDEDARHFLSDAGIHDQSLQEAIIDLTRVRPNEIHPFYLALCADIVRVRKGKDQEVSASDFQSSNANVEQKQRLVVTRLLSCVESEVEYAVLALSACRSFDEAIYRELGEKMHFQATKPSFKTLTEFSFVWSFERYDKTWYRMHELLQRMASLIEQDAVKEAHRVLEDYYDDRYQNGMAAAQIEAIYHASRLDPVRGTTRWIEAFDEAVRGRQYEQCAGLIEVLQQMEVTQGRDSARIAALEGDYYRSITGYEESEASYDEAIDTYKRELEQAPTDLLLLNGLAWVYRRSGELDAERGEADKAAQSYDAALKTIQRALEIAPGDCSLLNSKALLYRSRAELEASHDDASSLQDAAKSLAAAVQAAKEAIAAIPTSGEFYNTLAGALLRLGDLQQHKLGRPDLARKTYADAIDAYDAALKFAAKDEHVIRAARNYKGRALRAVAELLIAADDLPGAEQQLADAISVIAEILKPPAVYVSALQNMGEAQELRGDIRLKLNDSTGALMWWKQAITSYDQALDVAPNHDVLRQRRSRVANKIRTLES